MASKRSIFELSPSRRSNRGETSAPKKLKSLTLFEDLLEANGEKDSSACRANTVKKIQPWLSTDFSRIPDDKVVYQKIKTHLETSLKNGGYDAKIEAIHRNRHSSAMGRAKYQSFGMYETAMKERCGGNANVICAWYGASKEEINGILSYGFNLPLRSGIYGHGFYFSAPHHPLQSLQFSTVDEDGLRHMLLCRVILGKVEIMIPNSGQHSPSSEEFDSAVDAFVNPRQLIIWNSKVNTHVLPEFVVSFRTSSN